MGGVTTWAHRTSAALSARGCPVAVVGPGADGSTWTQGLEGVDAAISLVGMSDGIGSARDRLVGKGVERVVVLPQLSGLAYAAACLAAHRAGSASTCIVGWMHTDIRHDIELIRRFMPGLSRVVCVSRASARALSDAGVAGLGLLSVVPTGHEVGCDAEGRARSESIDGTLRLLYVGRLEAFQKRVLALPGIAAGLRERGVAATLTVIGDGPARGALEREVERVSVGHLVNLVGSLGMSELETRYLDHDLLVQPSRSEGLGLARIEGATLGCVPVVTPSGSAEGITPGVDGMVVDVAPGDDDHAAARAFVDAIASLTPDRLGAMSRRAIESSRVEFGMNRFADRLVSVLRDAVATDSNRSAWGRVASDPDRAAAFTVPDDVGERVRAIAETLGDRPVALHGAGAHTAAIWAELMQQGVRVVAICDDDPERWGGMLLGVPVIAPGDARSTGASDVLISSWLHEYAVWFRRSVYESQGLRVVCLYGADVARGSDRSRDQRAVAR